MIMSSNIHKIKTKINFPKMRDKILKDCLVLAILNNFSKPLPKLTLLRIFKTTATINLSQATT